MNCKQGFDKKDRFQVRETQVSWFRGDDEVDFRHIQCPTEARRQLATENSLTGASTEAAKPNET
jgi:hypothetical protein